MSIDRRQEVALRSRGCRVGVRAIALLAASLLLACLAFGAIFFFLAVFWQSRPSSLAEISEYTGLEFPPGTRLVGSHWSLGVDHSIAAKVEMSRADGESFVAGLPESAELSRSERLDEVRFSRGFEWWDPESAPRRSLYAQFRAGRGGVEVQVARSGRERVVVYILYGS